MFPPLYWPFRFETPVYGSDIRQAIRWLLTEDNYLGEIVVHRVRPIDRPQLDGLPCITYQVFENKSGHWHGSRSDGNQCLVTVEVWALTLAEAVALKRGVERLLDGYSGCVLNLDIPWIEKRSERDLSHQRDDGSGDYVYRLALDFFAKHTEP